MAYDNHGKPIIPVNQHNPNQFVPSAPGSAPYPPYPVNPQPHGGPAPQVGWALHPTNVAPPYPTNNIAYDQQGRPINAVPVPTQPMYGAPVYGQPGYGVGPGHGQHPPYPTYGVPTSAPSATVYKPIDKKHKKDKDKKDKDKKEKKSKGQFALRKGTKVARALVTQLEKKLK